MPQNPSTGKTIRHAMSRAEILEYRLKQTDEPSAPSAVKRGKRRARNSPDAGESEGSGLAPSPLATLSGLGGLTLDSGGSSAADTPADSPSTLAHQPTLAAPTPASAPKTHGGSKRSGMSVLCPPTAAPAKNSADVTAEVPSTSQLLKPTPRQASSSRGDTSPGSDAGAAARLDRLESRLDRVEKWADEFHGRLNQLGV